MPASYPPHGLDPWDPALQAYLLGGHSDPGIDGTPGMRHKQPIIAKEYGITGDGLTDQCAALNTLISQVSTAGGNSGVWGVVNFSAITGGAINTTGGNGGTHAGIVIATIGGTTYYYGQGGAGGGSSVTGVAGSGGNGSGFGSGGGGGGSSLNTHNSGAGGNGGPGLAIITTWAS